MGHPVFYGTIYCERRFRLICIQTQMLQWLTPFSKQRRLTFAQMFRTHLEKHPEVLPLIWFSDEAHFWLSGYVNKQNCRIWSMENAHEYETTELGTLIRRFYRVLKENFWLVSMRWLKPAVVTLKQSFIKFSYFFYFNKFPWILIF